MADHLLVFQNDSFHSQFNGYAAQAYHFNQFKAFRRQFAKAVNQSCFKLYKGFFGFQVNQLAVKEHTLRGALDITIRKQKLHIGIYLAVVAKFHVQVVP